MKTIAENANDFADLRTADGGNCVYVDKTDYFHRLVTAGSKKLFFIARPRRFAADDPAKGFYDWSAAAKADWKQFFEQIPHDGTDAEHRTFYTDRYFEETK